MTKQSKTKTPATVRNTSDANETDNPIHPAPDIRDEPRRSEPGPSGTSQAQPELSEQRHVTSTQQGTPPSKT